MYRVVIKSRTGDGFDHVAVVASRIRRFNGALKIRDNQAENTADHLRSHAAVGGRVVSGSHHSDPNAVVLVALDGAGKVVTMRTLTIEDEHAVKIPDDILEDLLLASLVALSIPARVL